MAEKIFVQDCGGNKDEAAPIIVWGHGWSQDHRALTPLITTLHPHAQHYALDFPGFGQSPAPDHVWGIEDYTRACADIIRDLKDRHKGRKIFWAGHSFGGRVAIALGAAHPDLVDGFILIAGAGLKPKRSLWKQTHISIKVKLFKMFKWLTRLGLSRDWVIKHFTSGDYRAAQGIMRQIFVRIVNEDLSDQARLVAAPALLLYGALDTAAPPDIGARLQSYMMNASFLVLDGFDHYTILTAGKHQVAAQIADFIRRPA